MVAFVVARASNTRTSGSSLVPMADIQEVQPVVDVAQRYADYEIPGLPGAYYFPNYVRKLPERVRVRAREY